MARKKLVLKGFKPIEGDKARRAKNSKTGEIISRREFAKRATKIEVKEKPPKKRETKRDQRARWYADHYNRLTWLDNGQPQEYMSFEEAKESFEFQYYEALIRSPYEEDRMTGYDFFEELEQEFVSEDWGETP
jgi:hypothetical protein